MSGSHQFLGDFETGNVAQYGSTDLTSSGATTAPAIVTSPVRSALSTYACGYQCNSLQHRCETVPGVNNNLAVREGTERFFGWSVFFSSTNWATGAWQIFGQWHANVNSGDAWDSASPPLIIAGGGNNFSQNPTHWYVAGAGSDPLSTPYWSFDLGVIPFDSWQDVVVRARFSTTLANCILQVWLNGTKVVDAVPPPAVLLFPTTSADRYNYWKVGYYRDSAIVSVATVYFDNVRIGGTYASVDPTRLN